MGHFCSAYMAAAESEDQSADAQIKRFVVKHFRETDFDQAFTIRQAGGVCLGLTIGLSLLLAQHTYFIFTSSSSIEYGVLIPINPFF